MIYSVNGTLIHTEPGAAVVECGGVGFKCLTSMGTLRTLPAPGAQVKLYTKLNVREDAMDLFGFATLAELNCFQLLTSVSGVGPRVALSILSELSPEKLALAVAAGDSKALTRANGVGAKLAQRIVLELKDKVKKMGGGVLEGFAPAGGVPSAAGNAANAVSALSVLGYTPTDAASVAAKFDSSLPTEELIRLALKEFGKNR